MKAYNFTVSTLGIIFLLIILYSCSNDSVVTSSDYLQTPLNEVVWNPNSGGGDNGGTTACRSTATSTACPGTGGENTGGELVITGKKHCSWLDAGQKHTVHIKEDSLNDPNKSILVRGWNGFGQLIDDPIYSGDIISPARKTDMTWPTGEVPIMVSGHRRHVCYQFNKNGQVKCYGKNGNLAPLLGQNTGQILDGTYTYQSLKVVAGRNHNAMLLTDGRITTWGSNAWGQLGTGDAYVDGVGIQEYPNSVTYLKIKDSNGNVSTPNDWVNVAAGHYSTCAIRNNEVWCAGRSFETELPNIPDLSYAKKVDGLENPVIVDAGESHACSIQKNGLVKCWGENDYGQLGDNTTINSVSPATVLKEDGSPLLAKALTLGEETSCAIDINDQLFCFGRNLHGLYGLDNNNPSSVAKPIPSATDVKQADLTWHHLVWLKNDGSVYGAGQNDYKQLQDGSTSDVRTPIQLFTDVTTTSRKHELFRTHNW